MSAPYADSPWRLSWRADPAARAIADRHGWCYRRAGWTHVGFTQAGLYAFQQLPGRKIGRRSEPMPEAVPVPGWQPSLFDDWSAA